MITNISWIDYWMTVITLLVIYYLYIGVRYFFADLKDLVSRVRKLKFKATVPGDGQTDDPLVAGESKWEAASIEETMDDEFNEVEQLIKRLKHVIEDAAGRKLIAQEFKRYLRMVLEEYPALRYSPLHSSISELIISECEKYGTIALKESEVELLWKEAAVY